MTKRWREDTRIMEEIEFREMIDPFYEELRDKLKGQPFGNYTAITISLLRSIESDEEFIKACDFVTSWIKNSHRRTRIG